MATLAATGCRIEVRSPRAGETFKLGSELEVVCDVEVPDPWFAAPSFGRAVTAIDGRTRHTSCFEAKEGTEVRAPFAGNLSVSDTGIDDHAPSSQGDKGRAATGYEVTLRGGALEVVFGHLRRGSGRAGTAKPGDVIGVAGSTGRCADGCGKAYVSVDLRGGRQVKSFDLLAQPLELEASIDGKAISQAVRLPAGQFAAKGFKVGRTRVTKERFPLKKDTELRIVLCRGRKIVAEKVVKVRASS
jgi:hypothetical protein